MNFRDLKEAVNAARLHDLAETNIVDLHFDAWGLQVELDETLLERLNADLKEAQETAAQHDKDADAAEARAEEAERKQREAEELLTRFRDEGGTLVDYIKRADEALARAKTWHDHAAKLTEELTALRKRKGAWPGYFAAQGRVYALLRSLAYQPHGSPFKAEAEKIIETLRKP